MGREDTEFVHMLNLWCSSPSREGEYIAGYKDLKTETEDLVQDINLGVINIYMINEVTA